MAITINGSGTITGISAGGLPSGVVTDATLASTLDLTGKTVTLPSGVGGKILQVARSQYGTATTLSTPTRNQHYDLPFSVNITPTSSTSLMLISFSIMGEVTSPWDLTASISRTISGTRTVIQPTVSGHNGGIVVMPDSYGGETNNSSTPGQFSCAQFPDVNRPANTNQITYAPTIANETNYTFYLNRTIFDSGTNCERAFSWITVMEVSE